MSRPLRILITENDVINQKVIMKMIKEKGYETNTANNCQEALDLYEYCKYDVIRMDIQIPVMNGIEASKIREKKPPGSHTPSTANTPMPYKEIEKYFWRWDLMNILSSQYR